MANTFFHFKKFTIHQDKCAMKVCTDACIFGAWVADTIKNGLLPIKNVLDIGTGTGLLSLMIAQKNATAIIDAVEIDKDATQQAKENFDTSPWKERLTIYNTSIQQFNSSRKKVYDFIISNPPFFENDLKSNDAKRNIALHSKNLNMEELFQYASYHINDKGFFAILVPHHRCNYVEKIAANTMFYLNQKVVVKQTANHNYFRSMLLFSKKQATSSTLKITIHNENSVYNSGFIELLKDYYLNF